MYIHIFISMNAEVLKYPHIGQMYNFTRQPLAIKKPQIGDHDK